MIAQTGSPEIVVKHLPDLCEAAARIIIESCEHATHPIVALSGGSTPKTFFQWAVQHPERFSGILARTIWTVSDERYVPLHQSESNFGNAIQLFLNPLGVPESRRLPWPLGLPAKACAAAYETFLLQRHGPSYTYDLCFLGLGLDAHTASIFPGSALIGAQLPNSFSAVDGPDGAKRLTINETGLQRCKRIVVVVTGGQKAAVLHKVLYGEWNPAKFPGQFLRTLGDKVTFLIDREAAAQL